MAIKKSAKRPAAKKVTKSKAKSAPKAKSMAKGKTKVVARKTVALSVKKPFSKSQIISHLTTVADLKKKDVVAILDGISSIMAAHLENKGPGEFNFAGLFKCRVVRKPATKAR